MAGAAPAIVKASSLMKIIVPSQDIIVPLNFNNQSVLFNKDIVGRGMTQPIYQVDEQAWSNSELKILELLHFQARQIVQQFVNLKYKVKSAHDITTLNC